MGFAVVAKGYQQLLTGLYISCKVGSTVIDRASHWLQSRFNSRRQGFAVVAVPICYLMIVFPATLTFFTIQEGI